MANPSLFLFILWFVPSRYIKFIFSSKEEADEVTEELKAYKDTLIIKKLNFESRESDGKP